MKLLTGAMISAVLLAASPAYADRGDRGGHNDRGHDRHYEKQAYKHHYKKQKHHVVRRDVHHYYEPARVYYAPEPVYHTRPAPFGISVILPSIFIPIR